MSARGAATVALALLASAIPVWSAPPHAVNAQLEVGITRATTEGSTLVERSDGLRLLDGTNVHATLALGWDPASPVFVDGRVRLRSTGAFTAVDVRRLEAGFRLGAWALHVGRGTHRLGRGERGRLLLDDNAAPFDRVFLRSAPTLRLPGSFARAGRFGFEMLTGVLPHADELPPDPRYVSGSVPVARPGLLGMRFVWEPAAWLELGMTRTVLFGGSGREDFDTLGEWWKLLTAVNDNRTDGIDTELDADQFASVDMEVRVPWLADVLPIERAAYYVEYGGTDLHATWQGDDPPGVWPIVLADLSVVQGGFLETEHGRFVVEYARIHDAWYRHSAYAQGYTHDGVPLGHPMGADARGWFFAVDQRIARRWTTHVSLALDRVREPAVGRRDRRRARLRVERALQSGVVFLAWNSLEGREIFSGPQAVTAGVRVDLGPHSGDER